MPQSRCQEYQEKIHAGARQPLPVASQRNVKILPEPGGEGDMPAPPELADRGRQIRIIEVLFVGKAEHPAQADGHVGVPGKIIVNLEAVQNHGQPYRNRAQLFQGQVKHTVHHLAEHVGKYHFLHQAVHKTLNTICVHGQALLPVPNLRFQLMILDNGTGKYLGKQRDIQRQTKHISLGGILSPEGIRQVGDGLEGVK